MDKPEELQLKFMIFGGILIVLLLAVSIIIFFVIYQRRMLAQQLHLQQLQYDNQRQLLAASIEAQEKERQRIGHDLHDEIGSSLSTIKLLLNQVPLPNAESGNLVTNLKGILSNTIQEVREISHNLYPSVLAKFGLADALQNMVQVLSEASGLEVDLQMAAIPALTQQQELGLYRMAQEMMNNAVKHADATQLNILLQLHGNGVRLQVADNGRGLPTGYAGQWEHAGSGLKSVEARASMLKATMQVDSAQGKGTRIEVYLPLRG